MKKLTTIFIFALILLLMSCQQVELPKEKESGARPVGPEFTALVEVFRTDTDGKDKIESRTVLQDYSVVWNAGDPIAIFQGVSVADKYQMKEDGAGKTSGTFEIVEKNESANQATQAKLQTNIALYPYESDLICTPVTAENGATTAYQISGVTIPSIQTYAENSFADESFLMAALTNDLEDHTLNFKNVCGALKLQLKGTARIKAIKVQGHNSERLSGDAVVTIYSDKEPTIEMSETASMTVTLECGEGVQLYEDVATNFIITVPPVAFEKGFTALIADVKGGIAKLETSNPNAIKRSYMHTMPEVTLVTDKYFSSDAYSIHISFDDVISCIKNLSINNYSSVFDEPFLGWLKRLHTSYGAKFSLYIYDLNKFATVPSTYMQELYDACHWLKFGLHSKASGYNYSSATYNEAQTDWNTFVSNVIRIAGSYESVDRIPRLHNFAGSLDAMLGMRDGEYGALGFLGADDSRVSYHLTEEQNKSLLENSIFYDQENQLVVYRTNFRGERLGTVNGMYEKMESFFTSSIYVNNFKPFVWFTHEPYVYSKGTLTEYTQNVEDVCRFASDNNITFVFPQNLTDF